MEETGGQVVTPIVSYQNMVGRFCDSNQMSKKRDHNHHSSNAVHHNTSESWNPYDWDWDSSSFVAKPSEVTVRINQGISLTNVTQNGDPTPRVPHPISEVDEGLSLKLRGGDAAVSRSSGETDSGELQNVSRPVKRVRSGSPGGVANYPVCQVDGCSENLSTAKDYHRRHKVCEVHSKAAEALVGKQTQRFCQQCSRFHPLGEFDEGKRSCRRRLAGHNRRRRKAYPEASHNHQLHVTQSCDKNLGNSDIVNLLVALSQAQQNNNNNDTSRPAPDNNRLFQIISNVNSSLPGNLTSNLKGSVPSHVSTVNQAPVDQNSVSRSTKDLLAVLTANPGTPSSDSPEMQSPQTSNLGSDSEKSKSSSGNEATYLNLHGVQMKEFHFVVGEKNSTAYNDKAPSNVPLQPFSISCEDRLSKKSPSYWNFGSSCSNNSSEGRLPIPSKPVIHDFFAMQSSREKRRDDHFPTKSQVEVPNDKVNLSNFCSTSLRLFGGSPQPVESASFRSSPDQIEQSSASGSNYSPSSLNSDCPDRTGRIIFKLFDKDPGHLPMSLRTQIYNWLSKSPSDMESYIRPGCIVLSVYISMSAISWDQLEENLLSYAKSLVVDIDIDFWGNDRFLVHTERRMASFNEGKFRLCKTWRTETTLELISVSPLAVVRGQETSLLLKGKRLLATGTKIHCTHAVGYSIRKSSGSFQDSVLDEIIMGSFMVDDEASNNFGRCYIEVENGLKSASFPVIVADKAICDELRLLELYIGTTVEVDAQAKRSLSSRQWTLHFLHELGWLFQRKRNSLSSAVNNYSLARLKFLLIFSVDCGFCSLVMTLLDILLELNLCIEGLTNESLKMLSESQLLHRAVKQRCQSMVTLLVHYSIIDPTNNSKRYIFAPNVAGPGGLTPLHLVACISDADAVVDALTSDPFEVGLTSWKSVLDANGVSAYAYATMRNNHCYNSLIDQKISDRRNGQISIAISNETEQNQVKITENSCSRCAAAVAESGFRSNHSVFRTSFHRPYIHSVLVVATVCVCVCVLLRGHPAVSGKSPFLWENLDYGSS